MDVKSVIELVKAITHYKKKSNKQIETNIPNIQLYRDIEKK